MHRSRAPFNVTTAGQAAAVAAIADTQWVDESRAHNRKWREWLAGEVEAMGNHGFKAVPSRANFLLVLFEGKLTAESAYRSEVRSVGKECGQTCRSWVGPYH